MNRIITLLCLLFAATPYMPAQTRLKVMSYNIRNCTGMDEVCDINRTAIAITDAAPDLVAVQEVDSMTHRSRNRYILGELANATNMVATFAPAINFDDGKYGIGILSREKPISVTRIPLPGSEEARMLLVAEFNDFLFCCTHLSLTEADRNASAAILLYITDRSNKPILLAGDFNAHPDDTLFETLSNKYTVLSDITAPTYPADAPTEVLDYIMFFSNNGDASTAKSDVQRVPMASDHRPVTVEVSIKP